MVIIVLDKATPSQKGLMSRLTLELKSGVFVGNINRRVRDKLWERITKKWNAAALMIYTTNTEQGFAALSHGDTSREIIDREGMVLTQFTHSRQNKSRAEPPSSVPEPSP